MSRTLNQGDLSFNRIRLVTFDLSSTYIIKFVVTEVLRFKLLCCAGPVPCPLHSGGYGCTACYAGLTTAFCVHMLFGSSPKRLEYLELSERSLPDRRVSKIAALASACSVVESLHLGIHS